MKDESFVLQCQTATGLRSSVAGSVELRPDGTLETRTVAFRRWRQVRDGGRQTVRRLRCVHDGWRSGNSRATAADGPSTAVGGIDSGLSGDGSGASSTKCVDPRGGGHWADYGWVLDLQSIDAGQWRDTWCLRRRRSGDQWQLVSHRVITLLVASQLPMSFAPRATLDT